MLIFTIETCTETSTLGLVRDGSVLAEAAFPSRYTLAKRLLSRLSWLLDECDLTIGSLTAVAVARGPGSFTGVRIGLAAAKMLAHELRIPLVGISTLEAIAYPFRELGDVLLAPMINARRQQAYLALFHGEQGQLHRRTPDLLLSAEPFAELVRVQAAVGQRTLLIGQVDGLPAAFHVPGAAAMRALVTPHALAALARIRLECGEADDPMTLAPLYLRSAAE